MRWLMVKNRPKMAPKERPIPEDDGQEIVRTYFPKKTSVAGSDDVKPNAGLKFMDKWRLKRAPHKSYLITMFYSNGTARSWVIKSSGETFKLKKRCYYLRYEDAVYDLTQKQYHLFFHEDHPVPIDREVKKQGRASWFSVTPHNLDPLIRMEFVKALVSSTELNKYLRMLVVITGAGLMCSLVAAGILVNALRMKGFG